MFFSVPVQYNALPPQLNTLKGRAMFIFMSKSSFFKTVSKNEESPKIIPDSQTCARQPGEQLARLWWSKVIIEKVLPTFIPIFQALLCPTPLILTVIRYKFRDKCKGSSKKNWFF